MVEESYQETSRDIPKEWFYCGDDIMQKGKLLEKKCKELFKKKDLWHHRFYDTGSAGRFLPPQPADFMVLTEGKPIFIECKESEKDVVYVKNFRPSQLKAMCELQKQDVEYYCIFLIDKKKYYLLDSKEVLQELLPKGKIDLKEYIHFWNIEEAFDEVLYK